MQRHPALERALALTLVLLTSIGSVVTSGGAAGAEDPILLHPGEASPEACVTAYLGQGLTLGQAATSCEVAIGVVAGAGGSEGISGLIGAFPRFSNADPGPVNVSCPSTGVDPRLGETTAEEDALAEFDKKNPRPPSDPAEKAKYWHERNALAKAATESRMALEEKRSDREARTVQAVESAQMLKQYGGQTSTSNNIVVRPGARPGGKPDGGSNHAVDIVATACQAAAAFVGECNLAGWATSPCQLLRSQLAGCADGTIALTTGDPGAGCPSDVDPEAVEAVVKLHCSLIGEVAPGFDPCGPPETGGGPGIFRLPSGDTCEPNPWSSTSAGDGRTTGEGCAHEFEATAPEELADRPGVGTLVVVFGGPGAPSGGTGGGTIAPPPGCKVCGF